MAYSRYINRLRESPENVIIHVFVGRRKSQSLGQCQEDDRSVRVSNCVRIVYAGLLESPTEVTVTAVPLVVEAEN